MNSKRSVFLQTDLFISVRSSRSERVGRAAREIRLSPAAVSARKNLIYKPQTFGKKGKK